MKSILLVKTLLGLVEMMTGLVSASFSLPGRQAVKKDFLCTLHIGIFGVKYHKNEKSHFQTF